MNWHRYFENETLERGRYYYNRNTIESYNESSNHISAKVNGTHKYEVEITLDSCGTPKTIYCSCPYAEAGFNCKHMAAVLFMHDHGNSIKHIPQRLQQIDIGHIKSDIRQLKRHYMKHDGFISYWQAYRYTTEVLNYIDREVAILIAQKRHLESLDLTNFIFETICDTPMDDDGELSEAADAVLRVWLELYNLHNEKIRAALFQYCTSQLKTSVHEVVRSTAEDFLNAHFHRPDELRFKVNYYTCLMDKHQDNEYFEYYGKHWAVYILQAKIALGAPDSELRSFYQDWHHFDTVCLLFIDWLINHDKSEEAIKILQDSISESDDLSFARHRYLVRLKELYATQGNIKEQVQLLKQLLQESSHDDEALFQELKSLHSSSEWDKIKIGVIKNLSPRSDKAYFFAKEHIYDELLKCVQKAPDLYDLKRYAPKLSSHYPREIIEIYIKTLEQEAEYPRGRSHYQNLAMHLHILQKIEGGKAAVSDLVQKWRNQYSRRHAMMDELSEF